MPMRTLLFLAACLVFLAPGLAMADGAAGSAPLLRGLWTEAQLAGSPEDTVVTKPYAAEPDLAPPARTAPRLLLPALPQRLRGVIRRVQPDRGEKILALTFDLCERASNRSGYRREIINFLRREGVEATFFAGGKWMRSHPEKAMQLMADPLFEVGNHTWTHGNLRIMTEAEARDQVLWTQAQYEILRDELARRAAAAGLAAEMARVPEAMRVFRLPYGRNSLANIDLLAGLGLPMIQWDVLGEVNDGAWPAERIAAQAAAQVRPGSIVLMHANAVPKTTQDVVPLFVRALLRDGWRFVTVSRLLASGRPEAVSDGYFSKPGDNAIYDTGWPGKGTLHPRPKDAP